MKKEVIQEKKQFRHDPIKRKEITMKYINKILIDNSYVTIYFNLGAFINNEFLDETYIVKAKEDRNIIANKNKHNLWKVGLNLLNY